MSAVQNIINLPWRQILQNTPDKTHTADRRIAVPRPQREPASALPTLDTIEKAIEASITNLMSLEHKRSDVLLRFDNERRKFQAELNDVNEDDMETRDLLVELRTELAKRFTRLGIAVSYTPEGHMQLSVLDEVKGRYETAPFQTSLDDLEGIEPKTIGGSQ